MDPITKALHLLARLPMSRNDASALLRGMEQVDDWLEFLAQVEVHGMAPLLLLNTQKHDINLPKQVLIGLQAAQIREVLAVDACYQVMNELDMLFEDHGVPYLALNDIALAPLNYPEIELRPMRDIDLLIGREDLEVASKVLVQLEFELPPAQPAESVRDAHPLPFATLEYCGFPIRLALHLDAMPPDVSGQLVFDHAISESQRVVSSLMHFQTLGPEHMLHQLCTHFAGHHPGDFIKLIHVLDIVVYAEQFLDEIDWRRIHNEFDHVLNTLRLLHPIVPLSMRLETLVGNVCDESIHGLGEVMKAPERIMSAPYSRREKWRLLLNPSDWWLHLHYAVPPGASLRTVKWFKHPMSVLGWFMRRRNSAPPAA